MPRKVNYGRSYEEDYDTYDDFDDDYADDYSYQNNTGGSFSHQHAAPQKSLKRNETVSKKVYWKCSICTFDNEENSVSCDICGVFRESFVKSGKNGGKVNGTSVGSGTPIMDKSLPSKMPMKMPNTVPADDIESKKVGASSEKVIDSVQSESLRTSSSIDRNKKTHVAHQESEVGPSSSLSKTFRQKVDKDTPSSSTSNEGISEILSSNLSQLSSGKNRTIVTKANSHVQYKPEKWMLLDQEQGILNQLNLAIVGHVDSGKSTLSGRLLHLLGRISKKEMHKNERENSVSCDICGVFRESFVKSGKNGGKVNGTSVGSGTSIMDKSLPSKMPMKMPNTVPADDIESKKVSASSEKAAGQWTSELLVIAKQAAATHAC